MTGPWKNFHELNQPSEKTDKAIQVLFDHRWQGVLMAFEVNPSMDGAVGTHFAPPKRTPNEELRREAEACLQNPVARFLIQALDGLVLILDANWQVLATNDRVLQIADPEGGGALGRRPGELFGCIHAHEGPAGCGTSRACAHCGAVLAVLDAQRQGQPVESECLLTVKHGALTESAEFAIVASPLEVSGHAFIAVVLHDLSAVKRREALERLFYHDVVNLLQGIRAWADILASEAPPSSMAVAQKLVNLTDLLDRELRSHRAMAQAEHGGLKPRVRAVLPLEILRDVGDLLQRHALAEARRVELLPAPEDVIYTDPELLSRVVLNMAVNAVEASFMGETITLSARIEGPHILFLVHNPARSQRRRAAASSSAPSAPRGRRDGAWAPMP